MKTALVELKIFQQSLTQFTGAEEDGGMAAVQTHDLGDGVPQGGYVIAVALLAKAAEAVEILADLGGGQTHFLGQFPGGDAGDAIFFQVI